MQVVQPIRNPAHIEQIQTILKQQSVRNWLLFTIGIASGLHLSDLLNLRVGGIRNKQQVVIVEEKTGKSKSFSLEPEIVEAIRDYTSGMADGDFLFRSKRTGEPIKRVRAYRILNSAAKQVGLSEIGTHTLRKTHGYHFYQKTKNINALKELFNHSAPSVTYRYIGVERKD